MSGPGRSSRTGREDRRRRLCRRARRWVTRSLGGKVGVAPRVFLKKLGRPPTHLSAERPPRIGRTPTRYRQVAHAPSVSCGNVASAFVRHDGLRRDPGRRRARFFDSYVTGLVTRDVQQISDIYAEADRHRLRAGRPFPGRDRALRRRAAALLRRPADRPSDGRAVDAGQIMTGAHATVRSVKRTRRWARSVCHVRTAACG
jgi:hypothetical protein